MSSALDKMLARVGKSRADFHPSSRMGKTLRAQGVQRTEELERIVAIPRRRWDDDDLKGLAELLAATYRKPGSTMELRPVQVASIRDAHDFGGLFAPIRVGGGKTLISYLIPVVLDAERPLLVIPAKLREKTLREFARLREHWEGHPTLEIASFELLGRESGAELLEELAPDLLIFDEAQKLKNPKAAVTRRVKRWFDAHPETKCVALSGTIASRSILDFAHVLSWCLPSHPPLPRRWNELREWAQALDEKLGPDVKRLLPGALRVLFDEAEAELAAKGNTEEAEHATMAARRAFRRRLLETPGVVATEEASLPVSLTISALEAPARPAAIEDAFAKLRRSFILPDGQEVVSPADVWRHARELALGFYYRWTEPAPAEWLLARRRWGVAVRHVLSHYNARGLDSAAPVASACARGEFDDAFVVENGLLVDPDPIGEIWRQWKAIEPAFVPVTEAVWIDDTILELVASWAEENTGIVFCDQVAFCEELAKRTGRPYYGRKGLDAAGRLIDEADPASGSVIASVSSNAEGRNLQRWSRALLVSVPPNGALWEQLLGRLYRDGQEAEEVVFDVLLACREHFYGLRKAIDDARFIEDSTGPEQKLLMADLLIPDPADVEKRPGSMWR